MNLSRRTLLGAALAAPVVASVASSAVAAPRRATLILSPHQDDEVIRLGGYITIASDRGDDLHLVNATDGGATSVRKRLNLTRKEVAAWRDREQRHTWDWLTDGRGAGKWTNLGEPDAASNWRKIRDGVLDTLSGMDGTSEVYVANWHHDKPGALNADKHHDHVQCNLAARDLASRGIIVRYARHITQTHRSGTATYIPSQQQFYRIQGAVAAYRVVGNRSTPESLRAVLDARGKSVITK